METTSALPKQEHIDMLMNNPNSAHLFDEVYGDGASLKYLPTVATTNEEKKAKEKVPGFTSNA